MRPWLARLAAMGFDTSSQHVQMVARINDSLEAKMGKLVWVCNHRPVPEGHLPETYGHETVWQACNREWRYERTLNEQFVKGEPQATERYTVDELKALGYVGYYKPTLEEDK